MNVRRLPGFMYHYKLATILLASGLLLVVYLLLHWGVMCTNLEAWRHVSTVVSLASELLRSESDARIGSRHSTISLARGIVMDGIGTRGVALATQEVRNKVHAGDGGEKYSERTRTLRAASNISEGRKVLSGRFERTCSDV